MLNPSAEFLKIPPNWSLSCGLTQRVLSALSLLSPPWGRDRCASFVSIFDSSRNSSFASRVRPPLTQPSGSPQDSAGSADSAGSGGATWGSFHVEQTLREDWVAVAAASEAASVAARVSAGRAGTAPRRLASSLEALPRSKTAAETCLWACPQVGGNRGLPTYTPHLHCTYPAAQTPSGFFFKKTSCLCQMLATEKILEGGIGGRSRGGAYLHWLCRLPDGPLLETPIPQVGLLCPRRATRFPGTQS